MVSRRGPEPCLEPVALSLSAGRVSVRPTLARLRARVRVGTLRDTGPRVPTIRPGVRCTPAKLLLDPYARALHGTVRFGPEVLGYSASSPDASSDADSTAPGLVGSGR